MSEKIVSFGKFREQKLYKQVLDIFRNPQPGNLYSVKRQEWQESKKRIAEEIGVEEAKIYLDNLEKERKVAI